MRKKFFSTKGCIGREELKKKIVEIMIAMFLLMLCFLISYGLLYCYINKGFHLFNSAFVMPVLIFCILALLCGIHEIMRAIVRRLHDRDKSGYWSLLLLVPITIYWPIHQCKLPSVESSKYRE